jgi:TolB-like protein/Tfp pilus assembly protein PilF
VKFLHELRRRRVLRFTGLYLVGAWLVIQVADISFPAWDIPESALRYLFLAVAACFPVALVFSWHYDFTARGIVRTAPAGESQLADLSLKKSDYVILAALFVISLFVVFESAEKIQDEIESKVDRREHSIAILPFTSLDMSADTRYFSDGITEEILHRLSTLKALHVLASTSSFAFRNSGENPARISEILGVGYLLQGSIRREADQVRVTARLLDKSGFQIWSDTFDRELKGIFAIQSEIARRVSSEIVNEIVPSQALPAGRTTNNVEAYNQFLIGKAYFDARTPGWRNKAVEAFQNATELDPSFAPPYAGHAMSIAVNAGLGPHIDEAVLLAKKALELDPDFAQAHAILGLVTSFPTETADPALGEQMLRRAIEHDPSFSHAYNWLHFSLLQQGKIEKAKVAIRKGLEVDPLNPPMVANVAGDESRQGNFEYAEKLLLRLMSLPEQPQIAHIALWHIYRENGRYARMLKVAKESALEMVNLDPFILENVIETYERLGFFEKSEAWFQLLASYSNDELRLSNTRLRQHAHRGNFEALAAELDTNLQLTTDRGMQEDFHQRLLHAGALLHLGRFHESAQQLEVAVEPHFTSMLEDLGPEDAVWIMHRLAFLYQRTGRSGEAGALLSELESFYESISARSPGNRLDPEILEHYALIHVLRDDIPNAITKLQKAVDQGWCNYYEVVNDIRWHSVLEDPEIQVLFLKAKKTLEQQRTIAEAADIELDFRAEIERLASLKREPDLQ